MKDNEKNAAGHAIKGAASVFEGDYLGAVAHLVRGALELADAPALRQIINDEAVKRANAIADAIEGERFGK